MRTSRTILTLTLGALVCTGVAPAATSTARSSACVPSWRLMDLPPSAANTQGMLNSVDVVSHRDVRFTGVEGITADPMSMRWNGSSIVTGAQIAVPPELIATFKKPSYASATEGWALLPSAPNTQVLAQSARWHDGRWTITPTATPPDPATTGIQLGGVAAVSADDAWAVGYTYRAELDVIPGLDPTGTLIERWDGTAWRIVDNPAAGQADFRLNAVTALSANNVWAVGYQLDHASGMYVPLIEHFDGTDWSVIPTPAGTGSSGLFAIDAAGPDDIWAVGSQSAPGTTLAVPFVLHYDGSAWTSMPDLPDVGNSRLTTVYAAAPDQAWATGLFNDKWSFLHFDGTRWTAIAAPGPQRLGTRNIYEEIDGSGPNDVWAAGGVQEGGMLHQQIARLSCGTEGR